MNTLAGELDEVLDATRDLWRDLAGARVLITGGTGFFGSWLLETFSWAHDRLELKSSAVVLTRDPEGFAARASHLADHEAICTMRGDVRDIGNDLGDFDAVIHAATSASADLNQTDPLTMLDTIIDGTRHILDAVAGSGEIPVLLTSSGAVYGRQPPELDHMPETWSGGPDPLDTRSAYAEGKRTAELTGALFTNASGLQVKYARCYAFLGPYLPLDRHYAIGNFIRDGLAGGPIRVQGDGTTVRSYLYAADLAIWLWTILLRGTTGRAYNVGSEEAIDIAELARTVARALDPAPDTEIASHATTGPIDRYVPSTERARQELGLEQRVSLSEGIARTISWHRAP